MRSFSLAALALSLAGGLPAANIITVANSGVAAPGSVTIASNGPLAVTFTTPAQAFTNVSVSAAVAFHTDLGGASNIAAFLTTSLGAGTTAGAHQIAATGTFLAPNIAANGVAAPLHTLFTGLSLNANTTYYLSIFHVSGGTSSWDFSPFTVTTDVGTTTNSLFSRAPSTDGTYAPASAFTVQSFGEGFFSVIGDPANGVPEPSTWAMMALGLLGVALRSRRN
jgi:hypothetical protein